MKFSEKLRKAMQELQLNQAQVCGLTGKCKGSISQYLSDKQVPSEEVQSAMASALGLAADYFSEQGAPARAMPSCDVRNGIIPRLDVEQAAKALQMGHHTVRLGLQQGVFPWGYAIRTSEERWVYFINAKRFAEIEGIDEVN